MNAVEIAAERAIHAQGGVLTPLRIAEQFAPVSCFAAAHAAVTDALLTVQLARQATAHAAAAHWAGQVNKVLTQVGHGGAGYVAPDGAAFTGCQGAAMSIAELTVARTAW